MHSEEKYVLILGAGHTGLSATNFLKTKNFLEKKKTVESIKKYTQKKLKKILRFLFYLKIAPKKLILLSFRNTLTLKILQKTVFTILSEYANIALRRNT